MVKIFEPSQAQMQKDDRSLRSRFWIVTGVFAAYGLFFLTAGAQIGPATAALAGIPLAVSGWLLGMRAGLLASLLCIPLNLVLFHLTGQPGWAILTSTIGGLIGNIMLVLIGGAVGRISDLGRQLRHELAARQRADAESRQSEQAYHDLAEGLPIGLYRITPAGEILYANPALIAMLGYPDLATLQTLNVRDLFADPQDWEKEQASVDEKGAPTDFEMLLRRADSTPIWVINNTRSIMDEGEQVIHYEGSLVDITRRRNALEEIKRLKVFNEDIVTNMMEGIEIQNAEGLITFTNPAVETLLGYSRKELIGMHWRENIPPDQEAIVQAADERRRRGESDRYELEVKHKNGQRLSLLVSGTPLFEGDQFSGTLAVYTDISQLKQTKEQLRQESSRLAALLNAAKKFSTSLDLDVVLRIVCEVALETLEVSLASIYLCDAQQQWLLFANGTGLSQEYFARLSPIPISVYENFLQAMGPVVVIPDVREFPGLPDADVLAEYDIRTNASVNLLHEDQVVGVLNVTTTGVVRDFSAGELAFLQGLANQASLAIFNAATLKDAQNRLRKIQSLRKIDMAITASFDLRITLDVILDQTLSLLEVHAADILLLNPKLHILEFATGHGFTTTALQYTHLRLGESYAGRAALEKCTVHIPDLSAEKNGLQRSPAFAQEGFITYFGVPLIAKGEVVGVLEILHRAPLLPDQDWLDFLESLAGQAAIAIDNTSLFDRAQRTYQELFLAYDTTLEGWAKALELRDQETEGHSRRVTEMTERLAQGMGIAGETLLQVRRGALLHDIGKMGVPDSILLKPGPLTEEEWEIMRQHPVFAYNFLSPIDYLRPSLDIPYSHHEKWDGTGYPRGLKGEEIPLAARIFAVIDVFDALTSDRPYRKAWSKEKTLEHIKSEAGVHFDPQVVEQFLQLIQEKP